MIITPVRRTFLLNISRLVSSSSCVHVHHNSSSSFLSSTTLLFMQHYMWSLFLLLLLWSLSISSAYCFFVHYIYYFSSTFIWCAIISLRIVVVCFRLRGKKSVWGWKKEDGQKRQKKEEITLLCMDIYSYGFIALTRAKSQKKVVCKSLTEKSLLVFFFFTFFLLPKEILQIFAHVVVFVFSMSYTTDTYWWKLNV